MLKNKKNIKIPFNSLGICGAMSQLSRLKKAETRGRGGGKWRVNKRIQNISKETGNQIILIGFDFLYPHIQVTGVTVILNLLYKLIHFMT